MTPTLNITPLFDEVPAEKPADILYGLPRAPSAAGYGKTLRAVFPNPAVKKMVFMRTKGLLSQA